MQPRSQQPARRVHVAEFKSKVLAECREPGTSVAAVALANGLNANLVRKWLQGRGLQRCGLGDGGGAAVQACGPTQPAQRTAALQFVPVDLAAASPAAEPGTRCGTTASAEMAHIHVELCRSGASLSVRWPAAQAQQCAAWLLELTAQVLK